MLRDLETQFLSLPRERLASRMLDAVNGVTAEVGSRRIILFCSDDYLGYSQDRRVVPAVIAALEREGSALAASPGAGGHRRFHQRFASRLHVVRRAEDAVLAPSTRELSRAFLNAFLDERDLLVLDQGWPGAPHLAGISRARCLFVAHLDLTALERILGQNMSARRKVVIVEALSSVSGFIAPLREILELVKAMDGHVIVDESSALGILGLTGLGGLEEAQLLDEDVTQLIGFDRTFGVPAAALCSSRQVCEILRESAELSEARALPAVICATAEAMTELAAGDGTARSYLRSTAIRVHSELRTMGYRLGGEAGVPIVPVYLKDEATRDELIAGLFDRGILVAGAPASAGKEFTSAIRMTISALHTPEQTALFLQAAEDVGRRIGILK